jgi:hypothetical protein
MPMHASCERDPTLPFALELFAVVVQEEADKYLLGWSKMA